MTQRDHSAFARSPSSARSARTKVQPAARAKRQRRGGADRVRQRREAEPLHRNRARRRKRRENRSARALPARGADRTTRPGAEGAGHVEASTACADRKLDASKREGSLGLLMTNRRRHPVDDVRRCRAAEVRGGDARQRSRPRLRRSAAGQGNKEGLAGACPLTLAEPVARCQGRSRLARRLRTSY